MNSIFFLVCFFCCFFLFVSLVLFCFSTINISRCQRDSHRNIRRAAPIQKFVLNARWRSVFCLFLDCRHSSWMKSMFFSCGHATLEEAFSVRPSVVLSHSSCHARVENAKNANLGCCSWYCLHGSVLEGGWGLGWSGIGSNFKNRYTHVLHIFMQKKKVFPQAGVCVRRRNLVGKIQPTISIKKKMFLFPPAIFGMSLTMISTFCQSCSKTR